MNAEKPEIYEYSGEGYDKTFSSGEWRVAFLNYAERFDNPTRLERHLLTDEVFVLLNGSATLITDKSEVCMEKNKLYNVCSGMWHNVSVSRDAKLLVIENNNTSAENTEYKTRKL